MATVECDECGENIEYDDDVDELPGFIICPECGAEVIIGGEFDEEAEADNMFPEGQDDGFNPTEFGDN